jgi:hypothetical protein
MEYTDFLEKLEQTTRYRWWYLNQSGSICGRLHDYPDYPRVGPMEAVWLLVTPLEERRALGYLPVSPYLGLSWEVFQRILGADYWPDGSEEPEIQETRLDLLEAVGLLPTQGEHRDIYLALARDGREQDFREFAHMVGHGDVVESLWQGSLAMVPRPDPTSGAVSDQPPSQETQELVSQMIARAKHSYEHGEYGL